MFAGIRQGIDEGVFDTPYPEEAGAAMMVSFGYIGHNLQYDMASGRPNQARLLRHVDLCQHITERLLGAEPGTFVEFQKWKKLIEEMDWKEAFE